MRQRSCAAYSVQHRVTSLTAKNNPTAAMGAPWPQNRTNAGPKPPRAAVATFSEAAIVEVLLNSKRIDEDAERLTMGGHLFYFGCPLVGHRRICTVQ